MQEPTHHTPSDFDLKQAQEGDRAAFGRVMDECLPMAYRLAYRLLGSSDESQDVCQDAFVRVWEHFSSYDRSRPFQAWLTTIVTRLALDRLRRRQRMTFWFPKSNGGVPALDEVPSGAPGIDRSAEWSDLHALVVSVAGRLPPTQRIVFALRDLEDLDVEEVASVTGLSTSSIKTNLSYARRRIREILINEFRVEEVAS